MRDVEHVAVTKRRLLEARDVAIGGGVHGLVHAAAGFDIEAAVEMIGPQFAHAPGQETGLTRRDGKHEIFRCYRRSVGFYHLAQRVAMVARIGFLTAHTPSQEQDQTQRQQHTYFSLLHNNASLILLGFLFGDAIVGI